MQSQGGCPSCSAQDMPEQIREQLLKSSAHCRRVPLAPAARIAITSDETTSRQETTRLTNLTLQSTQACQHIICGTRAHSTKTCSREKAGNGRNCELLLGAGLKSILNTPVRTFCVVCCINVVKERQVRKVVHVHFIVKGDYDAVSSEAYSANIAAERQLPDTAVLVIIPNHHFRQGVARDTPATNQRKDVAAKKHFNYSNASPEAVREEYLALDKGVTTYRLLTKKSLCGTSL